MAERCDTCKFSAVYGWSNTRQRYVPDSEGSIRLCRKSAPDPEFHFPTVEDEEWCGGYEAA